MFNQNYVYITQLIKLKSLNSSWIHELWIEVTHTKENQY